MSADGHRVDGVGHSLAAVGAAATIVLLTACTATTATGLAATSSTTSAAASGTTVAPAASPFAGRWPVTTLAQATELQQAVDRGQQPWLLDPSEVAVSYARAELGMTSPQVVRSDSGVVQLRQGTGARVVTVTLVQPVRAGPTGIWVVTESR